MDAPQPIISIVIPTHNRAAELEQTLASIAAQTFSQWEALIIDDRCTDDTAPRVTKIAADDPRFRYLKLPADKQGAPAARNFGAAESHGEFVIFLDSDDLLAPYCFQQRVEQMRQHPDVDFLVFPCELFRQTPGDVGLLWNADTGADDLDRMLKMDVIWQTTSPIWRRTALAKFAPWDEEVLSGQDWEFHIRALLAKLRYERIDSRDCFWRMAASERDSIGKSSFQPQMTRARPAGIEKILHAVQSAGAETPARREMFAGMYFQSAERLAQRVSRVEGRKVWRIALDKDLITRRQFRQGQRYLFIMRWPKIANLLRKRLERGWPVRFFIHRTETYLKTPVGPQHRPASETAAPLPAEVGR